MRNLFFSTTLLNLSFLLIYNVLFVDSEALKPRRERSLWASRWRNSKKAFKRKFEEYYKCKEKSEKEEKKVTDTITAILALEGQRVNLPCPLCVRPDQTPRIHWQRIRTADSSIVNVRQGLHGMKVKKDLTLVIKSVDLIHAGQYFCIHEGDAVIIYQVDVLFREPQRTVYENNTSTLLRSQRLLDHNLEVRLSISYLDVDRLS